MKDSVNFSSRMPDCIIRPMKTRPPIPMFPSLALRISIIYYIDLIEEVSDLKFKLTIITEERNNFLDRVGHL